MKQIILRLGLVCLLCMVFALNAVADGLNDELVTMAENGQADAVRALLDEGADVNARNAFFFGREHGARDTFIEHES